MRLSIVIVTRDRRPTLLRTLERVRSNPRTDLSSTELLVVDNASTDGSPEAVAQAWPGATIIVRKTNEGVSARNYAFAVARGKYVLLIDDDSYPLHDAVERSMSYMDHNPQTAAVVGRVVLPDDRLEACALPTIINNCAVCLRKSALDQVGGFPVEFFRQAEEYDMSLRLWQAGWRVERFEDVVYRHEKAPGNRAPSWVHRLDVRNNLIVAQRYLPANLRQSFSEDWTQRYLALASHAGHVAAARGGVWEAKVWALRESLRGRQTLSPVAIESIFGFESQANAIAHWARTHNLRRVIIADLSKCLFVTMQACVSAGLEVLAIADNNPAYAGLNYRGVPVLADKECWRVAEDGIVLSNVNPAQVDTRMSQLRWWCPRPLLRLWHPQALSATAGSGETGQRDPGSERVPSAA